jgi:hypothetical protein
MSDEQPTKKRRIELHVQVELPHDVIWLILQFLHTKYLTVAALTHKSWHKIVNDPSFWKTLFSRDYPDLTIPEEDILNAYKNVNKCFIEGIEIPKKWLGFGLPNRPCGGTYDTYAWEEVPRLNRKLDGSFNWLLKTLDKKDDLKILEAQKSAKVIFPQDYITFISSKGLKNTIESPTACFVVDDIDVIPFHSGYLVEFYCDSQGCVHWYSYFENKNSKCVNRAVLASWCIAEELKEFEDIKEIVDQGTLSWSARSVEEFIYRITLENNLWLKTHNYDKNPLSQEEQEYARFYEENKLLLASNHKSLFAWM